jgi:hypothetical protein
LQGVAAEERYLVVAEVLAAIVNLQRKRLVLQLITPLQSALVALELPQAVLEKPQVQKVVILFLPLLPLRGVVALALIIIL